MMKNTVTNRQLFYLLFVTLTTSSLIPAAKDLAVSAGHGAWIPLILTALLFAVMASIIIRLNSMFPGDTLFEYSGKIFWKFVPYLLAVIYILYFSAISCYYCTTFFALIKANFLPETPEWALLLFTMPFLGLIAYRGITNAARLVVIVGFLFLFVSVILFVTMFFEGQLSHVLPLFIKSELGSCFTAIKDSFRLYTGISILTLIPISQANKKPSKFVFFSILGIGLFYLISVYGCYAMIGIDEIKYHKYALIDAIRLIRYMKIEFFQRVDILYMTLGFMRVIGAKSFVYLAVTEYLCKILPKAKRSIIIIVVGVVFYFIDLFAFGVPNVEQKFNYVLSTFAFFASFLIPLTLLITAKVKKYGH